MIAILQEDLPYIVLTEDPYLEAYNSDAIANVERLCPAETGHLLLPAGLLRAAADARARRGPRAAVATNRRPRRRGRDRRGVRRDRGLLRSAARAGGARSSRWSSKRERRQPVNARWLAGKVGAAVLTLIFVLIFNFFLFRGLGDPTTQLARLPQSNPEEIEQLRASLRARQAAARPVRRLRRRHAHLRPRDQPATPASRSGTRSRRRSPGPCCWSAPGRCWRRSSAPGWGCVAATKRGKKDRRGPTQLQPVHLLGARVLDRDHPDPRVRGRDTDIPGRAAGDARRGVLELVLRGARRRATTWCYPRRR